MGVASIAFVGMSTRARVAIVTGGNRGMGLETCRQLAQRGYRVILTSRNADDGVAASRQLMKHGLEVHARALDVTDSAGIASLAREVGLLEMSTVGTTTR